MEMTTIAISKELKSKIGEFGNKGETFSDILERLVKSAQKRLLHDLLFNEEGFVPVKDALERAKAKWQK
jgi:predicted CopG family antitoxin